MVTKLARYGSAIQRAVASKPGFVLVAEISQQPLPEMIEYARREERTPAGVAVEIASVVFACPAPLRHGNVFMEANEGAEKRETHLRNERKEDWRTTEATRKGAKEGGAAGRGRTARERREPEY
eukprot:8861327-Pyramimonas_sp.AAC.1